MLLDLQIALVLAVLCGVMLAESRAANPGSRYDSLTWWTGWVLFVVALLFTGSGLLNG